MRAKIPGTSSNSPTAKQHLGWGRGSASSVAAAPLFPPQRLGRALRTRASPGGSSSSPVCRVPKFSSPTLQRPTVRSTDLRIVITEAPGLRAATGGKNPKASCRCPIGHSGSPVPHLCLTNHHTIHTHGIRDVVLDPAMTPDL